MKWLELFALFIKELVLSAVNVGWLAVQPQIRLRPGLIAYPLAVTSDWQITVLANLITLTPGTLSVDVSDDRRTLYIHVLDMEDREKVIGAIAAGFETKVLEVLR
jgi:multicomponent Na+:H+ antiporter subunit E